MNVIISFLITKGSKIEQHTENLMTFWVRDRKSYEYCLEKKGKNLILTKHSSSTGECCSPEMTRVSEWGMIKLMQELIF